LKGRKNPRIRLSLLEYRQGHLLSLCSDIYWQELGARPVPLQYPGPDPTDSNLCWRWCGAAATAPSFSWVSARIG
jgi:hypothetical protein